MKLFTIKNGGYTAIIDVDNGANCVSLRHEKISGSILREPSLTGEKKDNPYLYGSPILFPVNRIENGKFYFEDRLYSFPINEKNTNCHLHGNIHNAPFSVIFKDEKSIVCLYKENKRDGFLHDFEIEIAYSLSLKGLLQKTTVRNLSNLNMPCLLGFHTTFNARFCGDGKVLAYAEISEEIERGANYLPTKRVLELDENGKDLTLGKFSLKILSKHYRANGNLAWIKNQDKGVKAVIESDEKFKFRLIYGTEDFICLEPQTCAVNAKNLDGAIPNDGFDYVEPFGEKVYDIKFYLSEEK